MESEAGHHPECSHPFNWCTCTKLYARDEAETEGIDPYEEMTYLDQETGWPYDDS